VSESERIASPDETCLSDVKMNLSTTERIASINELNASAIETLVSEPEEVLSTPEMILSAPQIIFSVTEKIAKNREAAKLLIYKGMYVIKKNFSVAEIIFSVSTATVCAASMILSGVEMMTTVTSTTVYEYLHPRGAGQ
jgi:hypothetical protein